MAPVPPSPPAQRSPRAPLRKRAWPLSKVYGLLETGPVLLLSTAHKGVANVMTQSWHTMMEFEPPLVGCIVSPNNHSFAALKATRQCVLNIPDAALAPQVVACGNCSGRDRDKFRALGLSAAPARHVEAPLIAECPVSLECRVVDTRMVKRYGLFVLEVLAAWVDPRHAPAQTLHHRGHGAFMVAGPTINLASRMK